VSIVEKAVGKERKRSVGRKGSDSPVVKIHGATRQPKIQIAEDAVEVSHLSERGLITVLEDKILSKAFRFIKRSLLAKIYDPSDLESDAGKVIMVSSAMPGAGKSFFAFNLAASIAREQLIEVVLIDADTVRHNLSTILNLDDREGLVEILMSGDVSAGILDTDLPGLRFVPSGLGSEDATELLASEYMSATLASLADTNTVVILDATPLLVSSEADAISAHVDHTIVVVEAGETSADEIDTVLQMLKKYGSPVSLIMNKLKSSSKVGASDYYSVQY